MLLSQWLETHGVSRRELARRSGTSLATVQDALKGRHITLRSACLISNATGKAVTLEDLANAL